MTELGKRKRDEEDIEDPFNEPITDDSLKKPKTNAPDIMKESARKAYQILSQNMLTVIWVGLSKFLLIVLFIQL